METLFTKDQKEKDRFTWHLIDLISDVAVIAEVKTGSSSACALQVENLAARPAAVDNTIDAVAPNLTVKTEGFQYPRHAVWKGSGETLPRELPGPDFKKAIVIVGFSAKKLGSSRLPALGSTASSFTSLIPKVRFQCNRQNESLGA
ncbi:MAG: hypothetical protein LQ345_004669 [Seirophora villosa]|nr:MAG: hypothetical protein LQ345_004669 [Seirophora villosa]